ncbi:hypothetical protein A2U01_0030979, partial [Trifolium medium]|nr:hypothetical protein [Trifolium medium]
VEDIHQENMKLKHGEILIQTGEKSYGAHQGVTIRYIIHDPSVDKHVTPAPSSKCRTKRISRNRETSNYEFELHLSTNSSTRGTQPRKVVRADESWNNGDGEEPSLG